MDDLVWLFKSTNIYNSYEQWSNQPAGPGTPQIRTPSSQCPVWCLQGKTNWTGKVKKTFQIGTLLNQTKADNQKIFNRLETNYEQDKKNIEQKKDASLYLYLIVLDKKIIVIL